MRIRAHLARLWTVAAVAVATLAAVCAAAVAAGPNDRATITVAKGRANGQSWTLKVGASRWHGHTVSCYRALIGSRTNGGGGCGSLLARPPRGAPKDFPYGLSVGFVRSCIAYPHGGFVYGMVTSRARDVTIKLSNRRTVHATPIAPPAGVPKDTSFFLTTFPCEAMPMTAVARTGSGRIVGKLAVRFAPGGYPGTQPSGGSAPSTGGGSEPGVI
jgi:hypothetical protein